MVERGGRVRLRHIASLTSANTRAAIRKHIATSSRLMTDEFGIYTTIGREFEGGHDTIRHKDGEYARGDVTTNTIESVFALLKRGIKGTFHSVTPKHLHRYLSEFEFRWNTRHMDDGERVGLAMYAANGKRLTYAQQVAG